MPKVKSEPEDFLLHEAIRIGYKKMQMDLELLLQKADNTETQKKLLETQLADIKRRLGKE